MKNILLIIFVLAISNHALACKGTEYDWLHTFNTHKPTIIGPFNIGEMESRNLIRINRKWLPFGNQNDEWKEMKNMYKKGDNFYSVIYKDSKGIAAQHYLIRNNCIIKIIVVAVS